MKTLVIEDYGSSGQVELIKGDKVAYAIFDETGWSLADEGEAYALPETQEAFAGWQPLARKALLNARKKKARSSN